MKTSTILCSAATLVLGTALVGAFPFNKSWHESATGIAGTNRAGAGGFYGTGGRQDRGIKCSHCHVEPEGLIGLNVTAVPPFPTTSGDQRYVPGQRYTITVAMTGEHKSVGMIMNNKNGMAATIENASGQRAGRFIADAGQDSDACPAVNPYPGGTGAGSPLNRTTFMYGDCHGVLPLDHMALTSWTFDWVAPTAGAGSLTMFIGMVDGDSGGDSSLDDDVIERALPLIEGP